MKTKIEGVNKTLVFALVDRRTRIIEEQKKELDEIQFAFVKVLREVFPSDMLGDPTKWGIELGDDGTLYAIAPDEVKEAE